MRTEVSWNTGSLIERASEISPDFHSMSLAGCHRDCCVHKLLEFPDAAFHFSHQEMLSITCELMEDACQPSSKSLIQEWHTAMFHWLRWSWDSVLAVLLLIETQEDSLESKHTPYGLRISALPTRLFVMEISICNHNSLCSQMNNWVFKRSWGLNSVDTYSGIYVHSYYNTKANQQWAGHWLTLASSDLATQR